MKISPISPTTGTSVVVEDSVLSAISVIKVIGECLGLRLVERSCAWYTCVLRKGAYKGPHKWSDISSVVERNHIIWSCDATQSDQSLSFGVFLLAWDSETL